MIVIRCRPAIREAVIAWHNRRMSEPSISPTLSLRDQVEALLPNWQSWYPSLFEAACDLGILRARVCDLSSLVLSNRHASIYNEAVQAFRAKWLADESEGGDEPPSSRRSGRAVRSDDQTTDGLVDMDAALDEQAGERDFNERDFDSPPEEP